MPRRPLVGITCAIDPRDHADSAYAYTVLRYIDAVGRAGAAPLLLPPCPEPEIVAAQAAACAAFCLIGSVGDYLPDAYGGQQQPAEQLMPERRHRYDLLLARLILQGTKPVLGICGGLQLLVIASGGSLVQDIRDHWDAATPLAHSLAYRPGSAMAGDPFRHEVSVRPDSLLHRTCGALLLRTNSFHHQAADPARLGKGLAASAWTDDGVVEAVEAAEGDRFLLGVQWHPERLPDDDEQQRLFTALVAAIR